MTMMPAYFSQNNFRRRKKPKRSKAAYEMQAANDKLIQRLTSGSTVKSSKPQKLTQQPMDRKANVSPTSDRITGTVFAKRNITTDHKWRKDSVESKQTIEQIERKAGCIAPAFNKGGLQYNIENNPEYIAAGRRR